MEIGTKIRKIRELKGFSQENIAHDLEMSITGYGKIERNEAKGDEQVPGTTACHAGKSKSEF